MRCFFLHSIDAELMYSVLLGHLQSFMLRGFPCSNTVLSNGYHCLYLSSEFWLPIETYFVLHSVNVSCGLAFQIIVSRGHEHETIVNNLFSRAWLCDHSLRERIIHWLYARILVFVSIIMSEH